MAKDALFTPTTTVTKITISTPDGEVVIRVDKDINGEFSVANEQIIDGKTYDFFTCKSSRVEDAKLMITNKVADVLHRLVRR